ncbi:hypothetical protein [Kineosporia sp. R_H_3]|uniref:hypothetical protein n=1 Tax=Kineosporia sp. R_H_3 TaxID=1961848 RepID=UPI000B4B5984|nr:hypothetical protein [Kineosporia sp. R_H_3]
MTERPTTPLDSDLTGHILDAAGDVAGEMAAPAMPKPASKTPTVSTSLRLKVDVFAELQAAAQTRGIGHLVLAQQLIEAGLAQLREDDAMVPLADVRLLLAQLARRTTPAA